MQRLSSSKAQTEPLGALVAIAAICVAVGLYAVYITDALPGATDRNTAESALETTWNDLGADGVFDADRNNLSTVAGTTEADLEISGLPEGYYIYIEVSVATPQDDAETISRVIIEPDGTKLGEDLQPPAGAQSASRPVAVRLADDPQGHIQGGTLTVEVWR